MCWLLNRWPPLPPPSKCRPYAAPTPPHTLRRDSRLERDSTLFSSGNAVRRSISLKEDAVLSSPCPPAPINLFVLFGFFLSHLRVRLGPFIADSQSTPITCHCRHEIDCWIAPVRLITGRLFGSGFIRLFRRVAQRSEPLASFATALAPAAGTGEQTEQGHNPGASARHRRRRHRFSRGIYCHKKYPTSIRTRAKIRNRAIVKA